MIFRRLPLRGLIILLATVSISHAEPAAPVPAATSQPSQLPAAREVAVVLPGSAVAAGNPGPGSEEVMGAPPTGPGTAAETVPKPITLPQVTEANSANSGRAEITGLLKLGTSLCERGDSDAAKIAYRRVLASRQATEDDLASALIGLARVYRRYGSLTKAAAIYEKFLKDYPTHAQVPDALLEVGRTDRALGASQLALARFYSVLNSTLKLSSEGFLHYQMLAKTAQYEIAETHFQLGEYAEASKFFSRLRLLDLAPADRARAHFKSAYALYLANDFAHAVSTLNSYLDQWPQDENVPEARYLLALSLRTLGRKQEALDATLQLLRAEQSVADPKRWSYWQRRTGNQLANDFFQAGDTLNALVIYQGLATLSADPAWRLPVTYQIGLCYERMRLFDRAGAAYQTIVNDAGSSAGENSPDPKKTAKPVNAELAELTRMAAWRLSQLSWHEQTERQLSTIFSGGEDTSAKVPGAVHSSAPNIDSNAPSLPTTLAHDQSGKPATAPPNL